MPRLKSKQDLLEGLTRIGWILRRSRSCEPQVLGKLLKHLRIGTIALPDWIVRIPSQVYRAVFLEAAVETATLQPHEHFVTFYAVNIETEHCGPTIQKIELPV